MGARHFIGRAGDPAGVIKFRSLRGLASGVCEGDPSLCALEHAVRAHDEVMVNRNPAMSSDYEVRSPAAGIHFQPVQRPGDENEAIRRATDAYIVAGLSHQVHGEAGWAFQDGAFPSLEVFVSCLTDLESDDSDSDDDDDDSDCSGADSGATWTAYGQ